MMQRLSLLDWLDWCDRAEKLGYHFQKSPPHYILRRGADGEVMLESKDWQEITRMIEDLEAAAGKL